MAFPSTQGSSLKLQPVVKGMVEIYVGEVSDIPEGWYIADGRTVTINGESVTLPDLTGYLEIETSVTTQGAVLKKGNHLVAKPKKWNNTNAATNNAGQHSHTVTGKVVLGVGEGGNHAHNKSGTIYDRYAKANGAYGVVHCNDSNDSTMSYDNTTNTDKEKAYVNSYHIVNNTNAGFQFNDGKHGHMATAFNLEIYGADDGANNTRTAVDTSHMHVVNSNTTSVLLNSRRVFYIVYMGRN